MQLIVRCRFQKDLSKLRSIDRAAELKHRNLRIRTNSPGHIDHFLSRDSDRVSWLGSAYQRRFALNPEITPPSIPLLHPRRPLNPLSPPVMSASQFNGSAALRPLPR